MNRFTGAIFVLPLLGTSVYAVLVFGLHWLGGWPGTLDAINGTTVLTAPLAATCSAYLALGQHQLGGLTESTARAGQIGLRCAVQAWAYAAAVFLTLAVVALTATAVVPHGGSVQAWAIVPGLLVLAVGAASGVLAIAAWPHRMTVVLVAPVFFGISGYAAAPLPAVLRQGPVTGSLDGLEFVGSIGAMHALTLTALIVLILTAAELIRVRSGARRAGAVSAVVLTAVVAAGGCVLIRASDAAPIDGRFGYSAELATACAGSAPRICLAPSERRWVTATDRAVRPALRELTRIGVRLPERYQQQMPGHGPDPTRGVVEPVDGSSGSPAEAGASIAADVAGCPAWSDPAHAPSDAAFDARDAVARWVLVRQGHRVDAWSRAERDWLASADSPAAVAWVRLAVRELGACRLDRVRPPWPATP